MFFNNRKLVKQVAVVISLLMVAAMLLGVISPYLN